MSSVVFTNNNMAVLGEEQWRMVCVFVAGERAIYRSMWEGRVPRGPRLDVQCVFWRASATGAPCINSTCSPSATAESWWLVTYSDSMSEQAGGGVPPAPSLPEYQWAYSIMDSSRVSTFLISMLLIVYGSFRSLNMEQEARERAERDRQHGAHGSLTGLLTGTAVPHGHANSADTGVQTLDTMQALCLPLGASVSLLVMFFFFDSMQMLFAICTASEYPNNCLTRHHLSYWQLSNNLYYFGNQPFWTFVIITKSPNSHFYILLYKIKEVF